MRKGQNELKATFAQHVFVQLFVPDGSADSAARPVGELNGEATSYGELMLRRSKRAAAEYAIYRDKRVRTEAAAHLVSPLSHDLGCLLGTGSLILNTQFSPDTGLSIHMNR